jgi:hypothetical protein
MEKSYQNAVKHLHGALGALNILKNRNVKTKYNLDERIAEFESAIKELGGEIKHGAAAEVHRHANERSSFHQENYRSGSQRHNGVNISKGNSLRKRS